MARLGILTLGQSPRPDNLAEDVASALGPSSEVVERGALDGLGQRGIAELAPRPGDANVLVTMLRDGMPVRLATNRVLEHLQEQVDRLEEADGVHATLLLCTGGFPPFRHRRPLVRPQAALYGVVRGIAGQEGRAASMLPLPEQLEQTARAWDALGVADPVLVTADPYQADAIAKVRESAAAARDEGATVLFLDCFGYSLAMRRAAAEVFPGPVLLARTLAARLLAEVA